MSSQGRTFVVSLFLLEAVLEATSFLLLLVDRILFFLSSFEGIALTFFSGDFFSVDFFLGILLATVFFGCLLYTSPSKRD